MINNFQKALWIVTSSAPIFFVFSISWFLNKGTNYLSIFLIIISILLFSLAAFILRAIKINLPTIQVRANRVSQHDKLIIVFIVTYILPFASVAFDSYNPFVFLGIACMIFLGALFANSPIANPLLFFIGYHFYEVEAENGIGNYLLVSKKAVRNKDELNSVIRISEYFLLDIEGEEKNV